MALQHPFLAIFFCNINICFHESLGIFIFLLMLYCLLVSCTATVPRFPTTTWNASTSSDVKLIFNFSSKLAEGHKHYSSFQQQTQNGEPMCLRPGGHTSTGWEFGVWGRSTLPCVSSTVWVPSAWEQGEDRHTAISRSLNSQSLWDCS